MSSFGSDKVVLVAILSVNWTTLLVERVLVAPLPGRRVLSVFPEQLYSLDIQRLAHAPLNARILVATALVVLFATALSALAPAACIGRRHLSDWLDTNCGKRSLESRLRRWSLAAQVTLSTLLLVGAGLFVRSFDQAVKVDLGIGTEDILVVSADLRQSGYTSTQSTSILKEMLNRARAVPGVLGASLSTSPPIGFLGVRYVGYDIPGYGDPYGVGQPAGGRGPFREAVSPGYFDLLGIRILQGRGFADSDDSRAEPVVIANDTLVRDVFRDGDPLGRCVRFYGEDSCRRIIGVVSSTRRELVRVPNVDGDRYEPAFYVPVEQRPDAAHVLIRGGGEATALISALRAALHTAAPSAPYIRIEPLSLYRDQQTHAWRVGSRLFMTFALAALLLAAVGTYALLAFLVKQRTVEIGIRVAIGASPRDIVSMALAAGMYPVLIGVGIGVLGAAALTRMLRSVVFGISPTDALTFAGVLLVVVIGLAACAIPARNAALIEPASLLRSDR